MTTLSLSGYDLVAADEFNTLSVANTTTATANWYLQQPWGGGFGDADMANNPQQLSIDQFGGETALNISMTRNPSTGQLESALISNIFPDGTTSFYRDDNPHVYVEARMWLPDPYAGIWPGFWGLETERFVETTTRDRAVEVDILEHYGAAMPDRHSTVVHNWNWAGTSLENGGSVYNHHVVGNKVMNEGWHTYGAEITETGITFYFDGQSYYTVPADTVINGATLGSSLDTDIAWMLNLSAGAGWPIDPALGTSAMPAEMYVDYFRMYELNTTPDPDVPSLSVGDVTVNETARTATFTATLSAAATGAVTMNYATADGTAIAGSDYTAKISSVTFAVGETSKQVTVALINDTEIESNERFLFNFTATGATVTDGQAVATIVSEDATTPPPTGYNQVTGTAADDRALVGTAGNDRIDGLGGRDNIYGQAGDDIIIGGAGTDNLWGQAGADTFDFNAVTESQGIYRDVIRDFEEIDLIDLSTIDANTATTPTNEAFTTFLGESTAAFTAAGQVKYSHVTYGTKEYTVVEANNGGTLAADWSVSLLGHHTLTADDFVL